MKRTLFFLAVVVMVGSLVVGCGTTKPVLGKNNVPMPSWVGGKVPKETGDAKYYVARGGKVGTSSQKSLLALSNALGEAAIYIKSATEVLIKNYSQLEGTENKADSLQGLRTGIINRASANTSGTRLEEWWEAADGEYYGLFAYDKVVFRGDIRAEVNTYQRSAAAVEARFQADKFFEEMEKELSR